MSGWNGRLHRNLERVFERGRRSSIDFLHSIRTGHGTSWRGSQNQNFGSGTNVDNRNENIEGQNKIDPLSLVPMINSGTLVPMKIPNSSIQDGDSSLWKRHGNNNLGLVLSAMYAKLLVVMGIAFPLSEVISTFIPPSFYDGFYLYLYFGSIIFMVGILGNVIKEKARKSAQKFASRGFDSFRKSRTDSPKTTNIEDTTAGIDVANGPHNNGCCSSEYEYSECSSDSIPNSSQRTPRKRVMKTLTQAETVTVVRKHGHHFGSFYLRIGAVAFGIGSMIYSGLEFGQYFELKNDPKCRNYMIALTPSVRMVFTFMQMYFIFLNSKMAVSKLRPCVWLNVLVQETKHEILHFYDMLYTNDSTPVSYGRGIYDPPKDLFTATIKPKDIFENESVDSIANIIVRHRRGLKRPHSMDECGRTNIMGSIVQNAAPFLFPCTIEYSLICAAICYVMWKSMAKRRAAKISFKRNQFGEGHHHRGQNRSPHHYTVDCARANKGLFLGIFVLVITIMSLIINFVFANRPDYKGLGNLEVNITEIILYTMASIAVLIGMCQIRELRYAKGRNLELDNILLIAAQTGSLIYNIFTIISGQFITKDGEHLVLITAITKLVQLLLQTIFILDASKRVVANAEQMRRKPGREIVTLLLVSNLAMWLINALEKSRGESHPGQLLFYGIWGWTIITDISMPMAIFYRFRSTVCLCEIWKKAYKVKRSS